MSNPEFLKGRQFVASKLNELRKSRGMTLDDIVILDEHNKPISKGHKSMLFKGERKASFWHMVQICRILNLGIYFDGEWIYFADREYVDTHFKIGERTRKEEMTYDTNSKLIGDVLFQWTVKRSDERAEEDKPDP